MMPVFDVLREPWIPLLDKNGRVQEFGMLPALERSHEQEDILCDSPLETYAVYRTLIAFLMDAYAPRSAQERADILRSGRFDMNVIARYVQRCLDDGTSFDLFNVDRPFMQCPYDEGLDTGKEKPVAKLAHALPSGNNHVHFDHRMEVEHSFTPAQSLRSLLAAYVFSTAMSGGYPSSINDTPCLYVIIKENNLFQTLVINAVSKAECGNIPWSDSPPAWRDVQKLIPKEERATVSMLEALTYRTRRVLLCAGDDQAPIKHIYFQPGLNFKQNGLWQDPHVAFKRNKKGEPFTVKPQYDRALWREVGALAVSRDDRDSIPPLVVRNRQLLIKNQEGLICLKLFGLVSDQAKYVDAVHDEIRIPYGILSNPDLADRLRQDVGATERIANLLYKTVCEMEAQMITGGQDPKISTSEMASQTRGAFFVRVHQYLFSSYLAQLAAADASAKDWDHALIKSFNAFLRKAYSEAMEEVCTRTGITARSIQAKAEAKSRLRGICNKLLRERITWDE